MAGRTKGSINPSKHELHEDCAYSARPDVSWSKREYVTTAAIGAAAHEAIDAGSLDAVKDVHKRNLNPQEWASVEARFHTWNASDTAKRLKGYHSEAFALYDSGDVDRSANALVQIDGRDDRSVWRHPFTIRGFMDLFGRREDGRYEIVDVKTGSPEKTTPVESNLQLEDYAVCLAAFFKVTEVVVTLAFVSDTEVVEHSRVMRVEDLSRARQRLHDLEAKVAAKPEPVLGAWCTGKWCSAIADCPAVAEEIEKFSLFLRGKASMHPVEVIDASARMIAVGYSQQEATAHEAGGRVEMPGNRVFSRDPETLRFRLRVLPGGAK